VVLASHGYPESPRRGDVIEGLGEDGQLAQNVLGVTIFHAGTAVDGAGRFVTNGGRVVAVTAVGDTVEQARRRAYDGATLITFEGRVMRHDIALAAL
ncbi:MAG TPA: phosphoribosylglycinamide synthetase C domain-containing protein, partial [Acidimicrobiales bacterium]